MAKHAEDREDLLREAVGYVQRVEFTIAGREEPIFCGFRECGAFSLYWTQDNVLQFNAASELRRAFWQDRMLASYKHKLHWLNKSEGRIRLERKELSESELEKFTKAATNWLNQLADYLDSQEYVVTGEHPDNANVTNKVAAWIVENERRLPLSLHPGLKT